MVKQKAPTKKSMEASIEAFREEFEQSFGDGSIIRPAKVVDYSVIPTGSVALDIALGVGGYIEGRITEIWGNPDAGKSTLSLLGIAQAQKKHPTKLVAYIDVENKLDLAWAQKLGVDISRLMVHYPRTAEDVADAAKKFLQSPLFSMIVIDSVGAMISRAEQEKQADENVMAVTAKIVTRMVKYATTFAPVNGAVVLIINQPRASLAKFGADTTTPGGFALKHCSTVRLKIAGSDKQPVQAVVKGNRIPVGKEISIKVERNKTAPSGQVVRPFLVTVPTDKYGPVGIDQATETFDAGKAAGVIVQSGSKYTLPTGEVIHSADKVVEHLRSAPGDVEYIRTMIITSTAPASIAEEEIPELDEDEDETPETPETPSEAPQAAAEASEILNPYQ